MNIMIVGVGGQGTLLASRLIGNIALNAGYDVKVSEVHGMSQRGGSVVTYVRYGECIASPIIDRGEADIILSFELLEAARWLPYLKKGGRIITNLHQTPPMPVLTGAATYPEALEDRLRSRCELTALDALALALNAGSAKAVNVVLIGVLSRFLPFGESEWKQTIEATVPERFREMNLRAFDLGRNA